MDFLGLRNLTVIDRAVKMVKKNHGEKIDISKIPLDDKLVYKMFAEAKTTGVFQFESDGMRDYLKRLQPSSIEDLIAMNALYRPGPMANIPEFIARKNGLSSIDYIHPTLESVLKETYGIIVYQEQVMQISQIIGGFTLAQGDMLRRAMGKKKIEIMAAFKVDFVRGAIQNKIDKKLAVEIFDLLEKFAKYGFNKSHSTAYALVAYQTAWLKTHYSSEFFAANLSTEMDNTDRVVDLLESARNMNIEILPPDVNTSFSNFRALDKNLIAYGLAAVKNIGSKASTAIVDNRKKNGAYNTVFDICCIDSYVINRKAIESLILAGACDSLAGHRAQHFSVIDDALRWGQKYNMENASAQESLFGGDSSAASLMPPALPEAEEWNQEECLRHEKKTIGFYLSGDPLEKYKNDLYEFANIDLGNIPEKKPDVIKIGGIIRHVNSLYDKKNRPWAIVELNGGAGKADIFVFNETYEKYRDLLEDDACIFITGSPSKREDDSGELKMVAGDIYPLDQVRQKLSKCVNIVLDASQTDDSFLKKLKNLTLESDGLCRLVIHLKAENGSLQRIRASRITVNPAHKFIIKLRELFGLKHVWIS